MNRVTCAAARELLLDADPVLLRAQRDSALERHLRTCPSCAAAARAVLENDRTLADALAELAGSPRAARPRRGRWLAIAAPLAAAAALMLVLWQRDPRQDTAFAPIPLPAEHVSDVPIVNAPATGTVAVMRTSNPNITIVWSLES